MAAGKILFIATSYNKQLGDSPTGCWVEEIASPFYYFKEKGFHVDIYSVQGGEIPFDPSSTTQPYLTQQADSFLNNKETHELIKNTKSISDLTDPSILDSYDALFVPGGHGIMFDGDKIKPIIEHFWNMNKIISSVCHGPAALLNAVDAQNKLILNGKRATGFSNSEEMAVGRDKVVPYSLEDKMKENGALFEKANDWSAHVVVDDTKKLITGQNPASSAGVAQAVVDIILPGLEMPIHGKGEGFHHRSRAFTEEHHHDHREDHPMHGVRHDISQHPQAHMSQWHRPVRQSSHTGPGQAKARHDRPDKSYTG